MKTWKRIIPSKLTLDTTTAIAAALVFLSAACGTESPADPAVVAGSKSTQITESTPPPSNSTTSAQASTNDGVLAAIQGTYQTTLQKTVDGRTVTQPLEFTIGQQVVDGVTWPTIDVSSSGELGTLSFGSYLAWELYAYGTTYALVTPATRQTALSEDYTSAIELLLTIRSDSASSKTLVPAQSVILIKDCGFFESVFASCSNLLDEASFSGNSFIKL